MLLFSPILDAQTPFKCVNLPSKVGKVVENSDLGNSLGRAVEIARGGRFACSLEGCGTNSPHIYSPSLLTYFFEKGPVLLIEMRVFVSADDADSRRWNWAA